MIKMAEITEVPPTQQDTISIEKFVEELRELGVAYNKTLESLSEVQDSSSPSENAMYKITLANVKRPASHVLTSGERDANLAVVMDFVESRQELITAQGVAFKAIQLLQNKQSMLVSYVDKVNGDLERKLSELTTSGAPVASVPSVPSVPSRSSK